MKRFSAGSISLYILLFLISFLTAARSGELTEITVSSTSRNDWRLTLHILGTVPVVHETKNPAGLMIFDFPALKSAIPNRAAPEDNSAVRELRWSQFSFDPLIFRLVLKPSPLWQCSHLNSMKSIEISCEKQIPQRLPLARIRGISLFTPLDGFTVQQIIEHSRRIFWPT